MARTPTGTRRKRSPSLTDIRAKMDALKKLEAEAMAAEREPIIAEIREKIAAYGITAAELGLGAGRAARRSGAAAADAPTKAKAKAKVTKTIRYRDGDNVWSGGRGRKPKWVQDKLAAGEDIEQYRVD